MKEEEAHKKYSMTHAFHFCFCRSTRVWTPCLCQMLWTWWSRAEKLWTMSGGRLSSNLTRRLAWSDSWMSSVGSLSETQSGIEIKCLLMEFLGKRRQVCRTSVVGNADACGTESVSKEKLTLKSR